MTFEIREYTKDDLPAMIEIWNGIVEEGIAFPQEEPLTLATAADFFGSQSFTGVAATENHILGLYILHPNNVGRCGHIANASYGTSIRLLRSIAFLRHETVRRLLEMRSRLFRRPVEIETTRRSFPVGITESF